MEKSLAAFTFFTFLLFAVSTARISLESPATLSPVVQNSHDEYKRIKALPDVAEDSKIILPTDKLNTKDDEKDNSPVFRVDLPPRLDFVRFHAINRHFLDEHRSSLRFVHRRPRRHFVNPTLMPRSDISHGKEVMSSGNVDSEHFHRQAPLRRLKPKHEYGHNHHRNRNQHHHLHHGNNDVAHPKHMFDREKLNSLVHQHKEKNREDETGFMKSIRKFLKHTFE